MDLCQSADSDAFGRYVNIFEDPVNEGNFAAFKQFIQNAIWSVKVQDFKTKKFRRFIETMRRKLYSIRQPSRTRYDRHFDIDQQRYFISTYAYVSTIKTRAIKNDFNKNSTFIRFQMAGHEAERWLR